VPPLQATGAGTLARLLATIRWASRVVYRSIVLALLAVTYVVVFPWFAVVWRLRRRRSVSWRRREDPDLASLERLRSLF
jgi:hypothetical protein